MTERTVYARPHSDRYVHRAILLTSYADGRGSVECQCGRGIAGVSPEKVSAFWDQHLTEPERGVSL